MSRYTIGFCVRLRRFRRWSRWLCCRLFHCRRAAATVQRRRRALLLAHLQAPCRPHLQRSFRPAHERQQTAAERGPLLAHRLDGGKGDCLRAVMLLVRVKSSRKRAPSARSPSE
eukprot:6189516-Pleurochrysis_carterae.AAC.2